MQRDVAASSPTPRGRRRWLWAPVGAGLVVLALLVAGFLWRRDTATPVPVSDVVDRFRAEEAADGGAAPDSSPDQEQSAPATSPSGPASTALPVAGVYLYRTIGHEEVDALGGARHDYPAETTITVRRGDCGAVHRWDALEERFEEWAVCRRDGALVMPWFTAFHQFFGTDDRQDFTCDPPVVLVPSPSAGAPEPGFCRSVDLTEEMTVSIVGSESVAIEGEQVAAVHVRIDVELSGSAEGSSVIDLWFDEVDGTLLRWTETGTSTSGSLIGDVHYDETFDIMLTSKLAISETAGR